MDIIESLSGESGVNLFLRFQMNLDTSIIQIQTALLNPPGAICLNSLPCINTDKYMLMKLLSHPGHGKSSCCIVGNWTCFSFSKMFHLSSKRVLPF